MINKKESEVLKKIAKTCMTPKCGRKLPFPQWFHTKQRLCAVCIAKKRLAEELGK